MTLHVDTRRVTPAGCNERHDRTSRLPSCSFRTTIRHTRRGESSASWAVELRESSRVRRTLRGRWGRWRRRTRRREGVANGRRRGHEQGTTWALRARRDGLVLSGRRRVRARVASRRGREAARRRGGSNAARVSTPFARARSVGAPRRARTPDSTEACRSPRARAALRATIQPTATPGTMGPPAAWRAEAARIASPDATPHRFSISSSYVDSTFGGKRRPTSPRRPAGSSGMVERIRLPRSCGSRFSTRTRWETAI